MAPGELRRALMPVPPMRSEDSKRVKSWLKRGLAVLLSLALVAWFLRGAHFEAVGHRLASLGWLELSGATAGFAASYLLRAARVWGEFRGQPGANFGAVLRLSLIHNASVNLLPLRSGEAAFPLLLTRWFGVARSRAIAALLWLRVQDAFVVLALAAFMWPGLALGLRALWLLGVALAAWLIPRWARRHSEVLPSSGRLAALGSKLRAALAESTRNNASGWLWTVANWSLKLLAEAWLVAALLGAGLGTGMAGALGTELAAILPVQGVAGFGTYEAGGAALLAPHGVPFAVGLQVSLALHLFAICCTLVGGGLAFAAGARPSSTQAAGP